MSPKRPRVVGEENECTFTLTHAHVKFMLINVICTDPVREKRTVVFTHTDDF